MFVRRVSAVLSTVTEQKLSKHADVLLGILVQAYETDQSYLRLITDSIVETVRRAELKAALR
jgi:hypothetical protein